MLVWIPRESRINVRVLDNIKIRDEESARMSERLNLAQSLIGTAVNEWKVIEKVQNKGSTGGFFSVGYIVEREEGKRFFLKALDYSSAMNNPNPVVTLHNMTESFLFEKDLLTRCGDKRLKYVIKIIDSGSYVLPEDYPDREKYAIPNIDYMVFEKAEQSARALIDLSKEFDSAWALRSLHNTAVGINELHNIQVAHQDIKPSNVLLFNNKGISKIGDVGRSSVIDTSAEHDTFAIAGDANYSPFELHYGVDIPEWKIKRFSCDMYMFGNLVYTYFNNVSITTAVFNKLPLSSLPANWTDDYDSVLPQIEMAFSECLHDFNNAIDPPLRQELVSMVAELCCPRLESRGDSKELGVQRFSMQRYISKLDYLARKYEYRMQMVMR